ncbi:MAG: glycoside hydrolase family 43 protein [Hyphomicrobiales bacterium]
MAKVTNPILPGFNPDPSICRVGDTYYIATSTFEWYPGVQIHQSTDLANWELVKRPLERADQLDMRGDVDSGGVWAPCLTYSDGLFWLIYTDMKRHHGSYKDALNYVVTSPTIEGPWSEGTFINGGGFDPSLFHDEIADGGDGRKWFIQMIWDHRARPNFFAGIVIQEFDPKTRQLIGKREMLYEGTDLALTEGPHIYKKNGYYYLLTAEGGTGFEHACTLARSKNLMGPYETHPDKHIVTAKDNPLHPIQRAGHGDLVETPDGRTYLVHLSGRPVTQKRRSVLGRETSIQECEWHDDWLYVKNGPLPSVEVDVLGIPDRTIHNQTHKYEFNDELPIDFQWLRTPEKERIFTITDGFLRLFGRESIGSPFEQALVARRQTHFDYRAETELAFSPNDEREMAGITAYYSQKAHYYLALTADSSGQRELLIMNVAADNPTGRTSFPCDPVQVPNEGKIRLAIVIKAARLQFYYALEGQEFAKIGHDFDATILSDEASVQCGGGCFTGPFVGMAAQDINGMGKPADFSYFEYEPLCE